MSFRSDNSKLKLVKKVKDLQPRNYWNTVGKDKEFFPSEPRPESKPTYDKLGRVLNEPLDEWWINSEKHHFCFWTLVKKRSQVDGTMEPLLQSEMTKLFGCSSTKVHFMIKEALDNLMSEENMKILQNLAELAEDDPMEEVSQFSGGEDFGEFTEEDSEE